MSTFSNSVTPRTYRIWQRLGSSCKRFVRIATDTQCETANPDLGLHRIGADAQKCPPAKVLLDPLEFQQRMHLHRALARAEAGPRELPAAGEKAG